jgi:2-keto-4-pentenoate hydratase
VSAEEIVATNIFHRAVAIGPFAKHLPARLEGSLVVNGEVRAENAAPRTFAERIRTAGDILAAAGERLAPGDRVITGSVVQVPVRRGDEVTADFGLLGNVTVKLA